MSAPAEDAPGPAPEGAPLDLPAILAEARALLEREDADRARELLNPALKAHPQNAELHYLRGLARYVRKEFAAAAADFDRSLQLDPSSPGAYYHRGLCRFDLFDLKGAFEDVSRAIELKPDFDEVWFVRARIREEQEDFAGAAEDYRAALKLAPDDAEAESGLGRCLFELGDAAAAEAAMRRALSLDPEYAEAYDALGAILQTARHEYEAAQTLHREAVKRKPYFSRAWYNLGVAQIAVGDEEGAELSFGAAIHTWSDFDGDAPPPLPTLYFQRSLARAQTGRITAALEDLDEALDIDPQFSEAHYNRGALEFERGAYRRAVEDLTNALKSGETLAPAYFHRGLAWKALEEYERAISDFTQTLTLEPEHRAALLERSLSYQALAAERPAGALELLSQALRDIERHIELHPEDPEGSYERGYLHFDAGRIAEARRDFNRTLELDPDHFDALMQRAHLALFFDEDYAHAETDLRRATSVDPENAAAALQLGRALVRLERFGEAARSYRRALELKPDDPETRYELAAALFQADRRRDAVELLEDLVDDFSVGADANALLGKIRFQEGRFEEALRRLNRAAEREDLRADVLPWIADAREKLGDLAGAARDRERATTEKKRRRQAEKGVRAAERARRERLAEALRRARGALGRMEGRESRENALARYRRALRANRFLDAVDVMTHSLATHGADAELYCMRGKASRAAGNGAAAVDDLRRATTLAPEYREAWLELGLLLAENGDRAGACDAFARAEKFGAREAAVHRRALACADETPADEVDEVAGRDPPADGRETGESAHSDSGDAG